MKQNENRKQTRKCTVWNGNHLQALYLISSSFVLAFLFIYSQPKAEALLAEVLIVKNDIAYGKNY